ncbi:hypothetical protein A2961_00875 [Candidatus Woesebacteria bacterium RIFCSPLOWO2_01_FULL_39_21]|uniref:Thiopeptide-type bacteriocin biosynthesis domain-containing protein n=1 Tax=Candidatus Woesebacteria bacterium RIFCSPLOWO2_01_FULL_39_21 TaxID=1802519 RepID=A0A1F8BMF9_9BACT|nr:MAG: hypothetical protein A2961_00875 [Candidatus Woesebacteria bacterium RIFCSPLOWO2_01_FULL_39_21]
MTKLVWISTYLYYKDPLEPFLAKGIKPFVEKLQAKNLIESFFFVRYWTMGKHIRLRLQVDKINRAEIRKEVIRYFEDYFKKMKVKKRNRNINKNLYPPGTLEFVSYRPETKRYGGIKGVQIAESLFNISSIVVLSLLEKRSNWRRDRRLGLALQMAFLLYLAALGKNKSQHLLEKVVSKIDPVYQKKFNTLFVKQKNNLLKYFARLTDTKTFDSEAPGWMKTWKKEMLVVGSKLKALLRNKIITYEKRYEIIGSLVHMNNNRLGISVPDESYSIFLLSKILNNI